MEQCKKDKFGVTELTLDNFDLARAELVKKGEYHLINLLNSCVCGELEDVNKFRELYESVKENIDFIDGIVNNLRYPGNKKVKM